MRRVSDERGAVAVIVALLLVALLGMAALVIDVGALYQERRELQNGADAAALALAEDCARGVVTCTISALTGPAEEYAGWNALDDHSHAAIDESDFDPTGRVTVRTWTKDPAGGTLIAYTFARVLGFTGDTVEADATVEWGSPSALGTFPLTLSSCEFDAATGGGTVYASPPYDIANETTVVFHDGDPEGDCAAVAGQDSNGDDKLPSGFGWLVPDENCQIQSTTVEGVDWVSKNSGAAPPDGSCETALAEKIGTVVPIPVFEDFCRYPQDAWCPDYDNKDKYKIRLYAAFYLTGYNLGGPKYRAYDSTYRSSAPDCGTPDKQDDRCVTGFFTTDVVGSGSTGGPAGGVFIISLVQ